MAEKNIIVATKNRGKLEAAGLAFTAHAALKGYSYTIVPVSVESGVSDTPLSDEEAIQGCANRLKAARDLMPHANVYVSMEGGIIKVGNQWYVRGWTAVYDQDRDRNTSASGASVEVPEFLSDFVDTDSQFSDEVKAVYALNDEEASRLRDIGSNGAFSDGQYGRINTFEDGIGICLSYIDNDRNWQPKEILDKMA